jgi:EpsD family peptidyl-prolyl cis-trans isomerase
MNPLRISGLLIAALFVFGGCGKDEHKTTASQVVAKVNGVEISVHQVNDVLNKAHGVTQENAAQAKREILNKLIDQQLAVEQAEADKLDRNPRVMRAIEAARRDTLARAHFDQVAAAQPETPMEDARKYYSDHPELFSARRVYNLQELLVVADALPTVRELLSREKSIQDVTRALEAKNLKFAVNAGVRAAEQLPLSVAAKLHLVKDGQTTIVEGPQEFMVVHVVSSTVQPVSEEKALPSIRTFLTNQRRSEAVAQNIKSLRDTAKTERLGEFALADTNAASPVAAKIEAAPNRPTTETPHDAPAPVDSKRFAKGVAGLK